MKTAALIASMPPMAAMVNKDMVNAAYETTLDQGLIYERRLFQILAATEDKAEGMAAFIEKREGVWKGRRSEEHTSELQSLMRISYAVFCLKKNTIQSRSHKPTSNSQSQMHNLKHTLLTTIKNL